MSKHNRAKLEKADRNKLYALKFKKKEEEDRPKIKKEKKPHIQDDATVTWPNWCRLNGHPASCNCVYPTYQEVLAASRR